MSNIEDDEPFLSRWSRMKRDAAQPSAKPADAATPGTAVEDGEGAPAEAASPGTDAATDPAQEPLDLTKLPRVEELTSDSDFTAFLDARVPAALRNAALGRMWTLDPTIRDFIEVAENQWNWNVPGGAPYYELMEPGSGAGSLVADASSAISRALGVPEPSAVQDNLFAEADTQFQQIEDESASAQHAALHNPAPGQPSVDEVISSTLPIVSTGIIRAESADVATQQKDQAAPIPEPNPRRRHGGALPA